MRKISSVQRGWQLYSSLGKTGSGPETLLSAVTSMQYRATVGEVRASFSGDPWIDLNMSLLQVAGIIPCAWG